MYMTAPPKGGPQSLPARGHPVERKKKNPPPSGNQNNRSSVCRVLLFQVARQVQSSEQEVQSDMFLGEEKG